jgi:hypothetical protein
VGTLSGEHSQTSSLIDQRCRPMLIISKCVSTHGVCGCRPTLSSALAYTRTHTLSHSLSLRVFVFFPFDIKTHLPQMLDIIEIQYSVVFGCSHFIGSTNTKVCYIINNRQSLRHIKLAIFFYLFLVSQLGICFFV